jgi:hypothetical protein
MDKVRIDLDNEQILSGLTGHFADDMYMMVDSIEVDGKGVKYHGQKFQIMSDGHAEPRGTGYVHGRIKITGFSKF